MGGEHFPDTGEPTTGREEETNARRSDPGLIGPTPEHVKARIKGGLAVRDRDGRTFGTATGVHHPIGVCEFSAGPFDDCVSVDRSLVSDDRYMPALVVAHIGTADARLAMADEPVLGIDWQKPQ